jgi:3-deoxy-D-manno-octulosonate 8-phosphate phosphatase KdsC-like HAD superfamily phosphatase
LQVHCLTGIADKGQALARLLEDQGVAARDVIYLGNDVNDESCLLQAGCGLVVEDAHPRVRAVADAIVPRPGGRGAVRAVCEAILEKLARAA